MVAGSMTWRAVLMAIVYVLMLVCMGAVLYVAYQM